MGDLLKKLFYWLCRNQKTGRIFTVCSGPLSQSIGRGRTSREGALGLDVRESRERRDKIFAEIKEIAKILDIGNSSFQWGIFILLTAEKNVILLAAEKLTLFWGGV